jgi:hypothetical protein
MPTYCVLDDVPTDFDDWPTKWGGEPHRAWLSPDGQLVLTDLHEDATHNNRRGYALFDHGYARVWCKPDGELGVQKPVYDTGPLSKEQYTRIIDLVKMVQPAWVVTDLGRYDGASLERSSTQGEPATTQIVQGNAADWDDKFKLFRTAIGRLVSVPQRLEV